ncbi:MAG TPA: hypothetical protein VGH94_02435 [Acidimicrobiales bacterium]|jgi:hypothetical protein
MEPRGQQRQSEDNPLSGPSLDHLAPRSADQGPGGARRVRLAGWRVNLQSAPGHTPLSVAMIGRLGGFLGEDDTVSIGRHGGLAVEMRVHARDAKQAQAIATDTWERGLSRAGVHAGAVVNVLVTTDPTGFPAGVRYESWVPERETVI